MNKILIGFLITIALLVAGGAAYVYFLEKPAPTQYTANSTPTEVLGASNPDFVTAQTYQAEGKYSLALQSYQKALLTAQDAYQATQIRFNIAFETEKLGKYADAIAQFKSIAADTSNYRIARAASVQEIGLMYGVYPDARDSIIAETFKDAPYDSFRKGNSLNLSYTKLFEYASSIYPLGNSESHVAQGYANELMNTLHGATTTPQGEAYLSVIAQSLQAADVDVTRMKSVPEERTYVPDTMVREGLAIGVLATLGAADPQRAEPYFKEGLQYAAQIGSKPGSFNTYNYVTFLIAHYGNARVEDVRSLLTPFRVGNDANIYPNIANLYRLARTDPTLKQARKNVIAMAKMDPDFQTYLISLGWVETDFK